MRDLFNEKLLSVFEAPFVCDLEGVTVLDRVDNSLHFL